MTKRASIERVPISTRLAVYFAINSTEELTTLDIIAKFGTDKTSNAQLTGALKPWVDGGWFTKTKQPGKGYERYSIYTAGPVILRQIPKLPPTVREGWDQRMARFPN